MQKTIHVNSYIRRDGTPVKEHYRTIEGTNPISERYSYQYDESNNDNFHDNGSQYGNSGEKISSGEIGNITSKIILIVSEIAKILAAIYQAYAAGSTGNIYVLQSDFKNSIQKLKQAHKDSENNYKKNLDKLINTKNKEEYSNLLKKTTEQKKFNENLNYKIRKLEYAANNKDYRVLTDELSNFKSDFDEVTKRYSLENPLQTIKSVNGTFGSTNIPKTNAFNPTFYKGIISKPVIDFGTSIISKLIPDAKKLWDASSSDFQKSKKYITNNGCIVYSVKDLPKMLQPIVYKKINQQMGVKDSIGVIFSSNSSLAKAVCNSKEIKEFFYKYIYELTDGKVITSTLEFGSNANLYSTYHYADILNAYIDSNGTFNAIIFDTWDFNSGENIIIQTARNVQLSGIIRKYYTILIIKIPKDYRISW